MTYAVAYPVGNADRFAMKHNDYMSGPHGYWMHFLVGLLLGGLAGAWMGWRFADSGWGAIGCAAALATTLAYSFGRWGDRAVEKFIRHWPWWH